jgi:hypothetical protein
MDLMGESSTKWITMDQTGGIPKEKLPDSTLEVCVL